MFHNRFWQVMMALAVFAMLLTACGGGSGPTALVDVTYTCHPKDQPQYSMRCHAVLTVFPDPNNFEGRAFGISFKSADDSEIPLVEWSKKFSRGAMSNELAKWQFENGIEVLVKGELSSPVVTATSPTDPNTKQPLYTIVVKQ